MKRNNIMGFLYRFFGNNKPERISNANQSFIFSAVWVFVGSKMVYEQWKPGNRLATVIFAIVTLFLLALIVMLSILLWKSAKDIEKEKDKQFVVAVFSAIVSFSALIIAIMALCK